MCNYLQLKYRSHEFQIYIYNCEILTSLVCNGKIQDYTETASCLTWDMSTYCSLFPALPRIRSYGLQFNAIQNICT